ncbi:MAG: pilus assembly protein TadG-related protein [Thermoguttaceae bacterium]
MMKIIGLLAKRLLGEQHGQALVWTAMIVTGALGIGGLLIDVGRAYVVRSQLQNYANASALAAAGEVYNTSSTNNATTYAVNYSAIGKGDENYNASMGPINTTVATWCLNKLMPSGETCNSSSPANAVKVTETASVPTFLLRVLGFKTINVAASATASMQGAAQPWNVAIVLDATGSMSDAPPTGSCTTNTEFACALAGIQTVLQNVNSSGNFRVALFSFPNVSTGTVSRDWTCGGTPLNEPYTFPVSGLSGYTPLTYGSVDSTYEVTPISSQDGDANGFVSDYYSGTSANHLNSSSSIVKETAGGCLKNPGGEDTYYAGVINAAQAALTAEQTLYPNSKNALIILSDGQANVNANTKFASGSASPSADGLTFISNPTSSTGYYPSPVNQCQQAIMAAQSAQNAGTTVYTVAFNSESNGCAVAGGGATVTDTSLIAPATSGNPALSLSSLTPCITMKNMASPSITKGTTTISYFYADTSSSSNGCTDNVHTTSTISDIFFAITSNFITPSLLPNNFKGVAISTITN